MSAMTAGPPRHPKCGGIWRGPFPTDEGLLMVCNACGDVRNAKRSDGRAA